MTEHNEYNSYHKKCNNVMYTTMQKYSNRETFSNVFTIKPQ